MRYRMLDVRIWGDKKFRLLSPLKPSGQALFLYLLSNPHTTSLPGLYRAGAGAMAEELAWSLIGFQRALKEVLAQGLVKADLKARVIFIPNAINYNKPQSPNVIRSWAVHWDEIPECALKNEAYYQLERFVKGLGRAFAQAFVETLHQQDIKRAQQPWTKPCSNQEQEQEQEQEQKQEASLPEARTANFTRQHGNEEGSEFLLTIPLYGNAVYQVTRQACAEWQGIYTNIDVLKELRKLSVWNRANPEKRKQQSNILRHIHAWLVKEQQKTLPFSAAPHSFPITFEHNLHVANKWLTPVLVGDQASDKQSDVQLLKGKKIV